MAGQTTSPAAGKESRHQIHVLEIGEELFVEAPDRFESWTVERRCTSGRPEWVCDFSLEHVGWRSTQVVEREQRSVEHDAGAVDSLGGVPVQQYAGGHHDSA